MIVYMKLRNQALYCRWYVADGKFPVMAVIAGCLSAREWTNNGAECPGCLLMKGQDGDMAVICQFLGMT
jgi:hypothetical protein